MIHGERLQQPLNDQTDLNVSVVSIELAPHGVAVAIAAPVQMLASP